MFANGTERIVSLYVELTLPPTALFVFILAGAIANGETSHRGIPSDPLDRLFDEHIGNAHRRQVPVRDDDGDPMWVIAKERSDSPQKIDAAMAACLSWEARTDAIAAGAIDEQPSVYETRGVLVLD